MNKELGRKITSLTLMTIMLTWSAAMGFSSTFMPEAEAANEHLYVSAEAEGAFTKAQVIEIVVVRRSSIADLDTAYGHAGCIHQRVIHHHGASRRWFMVCLRCRRRLFQS